MKTASVTETKNRLSALLAEVRAGETILIVDRGVPVARIEPVEARTDDGDGRLARLERAGLVKRGRGEPPILNEPPPPLPPGMSAVEALLEERRSGR